MQWFYAENGQQAGPVEDDVLAEMVRSGKIDGNTLVWCANMTNWEPYGQIARRLGLGEAAPIAIDTANSFFCAECGRRFNADDMVQYGGQYVCAECKPTFFQKIIEGVSPGGQFNYAGFWIRFAAKIIDWIILFVATLPIRFVFGFGNFFGDPSPTAMLPFLMLASFSGLLNLVVGLSYEVFFNGRYGQTPGKMVCGIRIVRPDGEKITYLRALGRYFAAMLSGIICYIGYIMAGLDQEKRALHDHICDTRVIYWTKR